jgi:hypothetical protein
MDRGFIIGGETMPIETLPPDALVSKNTRYDTDDIVGNIQDSPDSYASDTTSMSMNPGDSGSTDPQPAIFVVSFATPSKPLTLGANLQKIRCSYHRGHGYPNTLTLEVLENNTVINSQTVNLSSAGAEVKGIGEVTFDANSLLDKTGKDVQFRFTSSDTLVSPVKGFWIHYSTNALAVSWVANTSDQAPVTPIEVLGSASVVGRGTVSCTGEVGSAPQYVEGDTSPTNKGRGSVSVSAQVVKLVTFSRTGRGTISAPYSLTKTGSITASATSSHQTTAMLVVNNNSNLESTSSLDIQTNTLKTVYPNLQGVSQLTIQATIVIPVSAHLVAQPNMQTVAGMITNMSSLITSGSDTTASATRIHDGMVSMASDGDLSSQARTIVGASMYIGGTSRIQTSSLAVTTIESGLINVVYGSDIDILPHILRNSDDQLVSRSSLVAIPDKIGESSTSLSGISGMSISGSAIVSGGIQISSVAQTDTVPTRTRDTNLSVLGDSSMDSSSVRIVTFSVELIGSSNVGGAVGAHFIHYTSSIIDGTGDISTHPGILATSGTSLGSESSLLVTASVIVNLIPDIQVGIGGFTVVSLTDIRGSVDMLATSGILIRTQVLDRAQTKIRITVPDSTDIRGAKAKDTDMRTKLQDHVISIAGVIPDTTARGRVIEETKIRGEMR